MSNWYDVDADMTGVQERVESGGQLPPGYYLAHLDAFREITSKNNNPGLEFTLIVDQGAFAGREITYTIYHSEKQFTKDMVKLAMVRFGLRRLEGNRLVPVEGKATFEDCGGDRSIPVVIEIIHEAEKDQNFKPIPGGRMFARVRMLHDPNSSKVQESLAKTAKAATAAATATSVAGSAPSAPSAPAARESRRDARRL